MPQKDMRFDVVDYIIFALLLFFSAAIGLFYGFIDKRRQKKQDAAAGIEKPKSSAKEYLLANKSMGVGWWERDLFIGNENVHLGISYRNEFTR